MRKAMTAKTAINRIPYIAPEWCDALISRHSKDSLIIPRYRYALSHTPTPLQRWTLPPSLCKKSPSCSAWIKRDDLSEFGISGNKVRKLDFILNDVIQQGCHSIITIGGPQSNHCRAVAVACAYVGLEAHLILVLPDEIPSVSSFLESSSFKSLEGNILLNRLTGSHLHLVTAAEFKQHGLDNLLKIVGSKLQKQSKKPYLLTGGGSSLLGDWGYIQAFDELLYQTSLLFRTTTPDSPDAFFDHIFVACGSGGTVSGLSIALYLSGKSESTKLHAISISYSADYFYQHVIETWQQLKVLDTDDKTQIEKQIKKFVQVHEDYKGLGYAKSTTPELQLVRDTARTTGILLDPVYTGKAANGMFNILERGGEEFKDQNVLFWHTGGFFGTYEKHQALYPVLNETSLVSGVF